MDSQLGYDKYNISEKQTPNSRNGYSKQTLKSELGSVEFNIPRDRNGEFELKILPKYQRNITGIEDAILVTERVSKKWTIAYANWDFVISQLNILFSEVLN